jgi:hypothetical protein
MALSSYMKAYCDIEDEMFKNMFGNIVWGYLKKGYNLVTVKIMANKFFRYDENKIIRNIIAICGNV